MTKSTHLLQIVKKRWAAFADLPFKEDLSMAKVNALTILQQGSYGIAAFENDLMICQGTRLMLPMHCEFNGLRDHTILQC